MDDDAVDCSTNSVDDINTVDPEVGSNRSELLEGISANGEVLREFGSAGEAITKVELDIACSSEKLVNLNILMMHVAEKENDFENFASNPDHASDDSVERALEFDLLSGILDSEVREMGNRVSDIHSEIVDTREMISSCESLGEAFMEMEEKLHDSEESLKQSKNQVSEMSMQSDEFQRILSSYCEEENRNGDKDLDVSQNGQYSNVYAKIKMQTAEQQRCILRMLEKSLARELDLEKKLTESRMVEDELRLRLCSSEQEIFSMEEEVEVALVNFSEADAAAEVFKGISKDLIGQLQKYQFNLKSSTQRETELNLQLQCCMEQLKAKKVVLQKIESSSAELHDLISNQTNSLKATLREAQGIVVPSDPDGSNLKEKEGSPEKQHFHLLSDFSELKEVIEDLKGKSYEAESRAESAEAKSKLLKVANVALKEELHLLKENQKVVERQLREYDIHLQHAAVSAEASQEKQSMLYSTIRDMEIVIQDLKLQVSRAERQAESAEEKCLILSESNSDLNEGLSFLRGRLVSLETSLHQAEGTKMETAKGINLRAKIITDLVMQLAVERERLYKQIYSLVKENSVLVEKVQQTNKDPFKVTRQNHEVNGRGYLYPRNDFTSTTTCTKQSKQVKEPPTTKVNDEERAKDTPVREIGAWPVDSSSNLSATRTIDAWVLNFKHFFLALFILVISMAVYLFLKEDGLF